MRGGAMLALLLAAAAAAAAASAQTRPARPPGFQPVEPVEEDIEADILERANALRTQRGLAPLAENGSLTAEARAYAAFLARGRVLTHDADGRSPAIRAQAAGYAYCDLAENLASEEDSRGFRGRDLGREFMDAWLASPHHRRNLLIPQVVETGVGVARADGRGHKYVAVQVFGRPEALRYAFKVTNRTQSSVSYDFAGRTVRLAPSMSATHRTCEPATLVFNARGSGRVRYSAEPGMLYVIQTGRDGLRVEMQRRGA